MKEQIHSFKDQAEILRKKMNDNHDDDSLTSLPPRSEIHQHKKKKQSWKLRFPMIRFLTVLFVLLPIIIYTVISYIEKSKNSSHEPTVVEPEFISVDIETEKSKNDTKENHLKENEEIIPPKEEPDKVEFTPSEEEHGESKDPDITDENSKEKNNLDKGQIGEQPQQNEPNYQFVQHQVQLNETLFRISMKYYQSQEGIELIKRWNNITDNEIHVGQMLTIPIPQ